MDSQTICDYRMVNYMKEVAKKKKITTQLEILPAEEQIPWAFKGVRLVVQ